MARSLDDLVGTGQYIDSRDLIERFEELETEYKAEDSEPLDDDELDEYNELKEIVEEGDSYFVDWQYGETLVSEHDWEDYARQLAEDVGAIKGDEGWPLDYIDWPRAAEALKMDYSSITIRGTEYWGRS